MSLPMYVVLGNASAGRRGVSLDVINKALNDGEFCTVFVSENEKASESDRKISSSPQGGFVRYASHEDAMEKLLALDETQISHIIFLADSTKNLADEIEAVKTYTQIPKIRLAAIWGALDCNTIVRAGDKGQAFADALSHFSDSLLLSRRTGLSNKQVAELIQKYEKQCKPHNYFYVDKNLHVDKPIELMIEEARRITMFFDEFDPIDELDIDEEKLPEEPFNLERKDDPYLERMQNGSRRKPIPNLNDFAEKSRQAESNS